jgi:hypothetical protein
MSGANDILLPRRRKDIKVCKEFIYNNIHFAELSALVPLWQKNTIQNGLNKLNPQL